MPDYRKPESSRDQIDERVRRTVQRGHEGHEDTTPPQPKRPLAPPAGVPCASGNGA